MHALLAVLIFTGAVEIWHIVVIEAVFGAAEAFFRPAYTGLVPQTVPEELLQDANAATVDRQHRRRVRSARRWPPRSCSASARAGRSRSTPRRSSSPRCS